MLRKHPLVELIAQEISDSGPMPFIRFMELALYHDQLGYYSDSGRLITGRKGDFFTNVSASALFGQLMAQQFEEMWQTLQEPKSFSIIEQGAHDGQFALDVLQWIQSRNPAFFEVVTYLFIEPSSRRQEVQKQKLHFHDLLHKCKWHSSLGEPKLMNHIGVFFSNELVDSFPIHRLVRGEQEWLESYVTSGVDGFGWVHFPIQKPALLAATSRLPKSSVLGYTTEVNLKSSEWIRQVGSIFQQGFIVTIDYGYLESEYYHPSRNEGTLCCYYRHQRNDNPLLRVGEQDITAHADFSALMHAGEEADCLTLGFTDQHHFLMGLAYDEMLAFETRGTATDPRYHDTARAFRTLMHPEIMGNTFKFLVQSKGLPKNPVLKGLRFAKRIA